MAQLLDDLPPTLSVERTAEILGISRSSAYRAVNAKQIPTLRIGRRILVPTGKLRAMLQADVTAEFEDLETATG